MLIHCVLGVSRSVTLAMAFLMHAYKMTFRHCFNFVKDKRGVASPNLGFVSQLLNFERRITAGLRAPLSLEPGLARVLVFGSHQREDPDYFVFRSVEPSKLLSSLRPPGSKDSPRGFSLDPRGALLFVSGDSERSKPSFLWIGGLTRQALSVGAVPETADLS